MINVLLFLSNADHPWLQNAKKAPNVSLGETVKARLKQFSVMNKLKKRALRVMLTKLVGNLLGGCLLYVHAFDHGNSKAFDICIW